MNDEDKKPSLHKSDSGIGLSAEYEKDEKPSLRSRDSGLDASEGHHESSASTNDLTSSSPQPDKPQGRKVPGFFYKFAGQAKASAATNEKSPNHNAEARLADVDPSSKSRQAADGYAQGTSPAGGVHDPSREVTVSGNRITIQRSSLANIRYAVQKAAEKGSTLVIHSQNDRLKRLIWIEARKRGIPESKIKIINRAGLKEAYKPSLKDREYIERWQKKYGRGAEDKQKAKKKDNARSANQSSSDVELQRPRLEFVRGNPPSYQVGGAGAGNLNQFVQDANRQMSDLHKKHGGTPSGGTPNTGHAYYEAREALHQQIQKQFASELSKFEQNKHQRQNTNQTNKQQQKQNSGPEVGIAVDNRANNNNVRRSMGRKIGRKLSPNG